MELARLRGVYEHAGPSATVYLEGRSPAEDAGQQLQLRWRALRDRLSAQDADAGVLDEIEARLRTGEDGTDQANGRVLVAEAGAGVVFDEQWDAAPGAGDQAYWTIVPELGGYVRAATGAVRMLVVLTGQRGARLIEHVVTERHAPREAVTETVDAEDVVERLRRVTSRFRPRVVVLAGEVQARTAVREHLPDGLSGVVMEAGQGGGGDDGVSDSLRDELARIASDTAAHDAADSAGRLNAGLAHGAAVQGHQRVAHAAEMGAVDTLLLEDQAPATREAFLLKVCAGTGSSVRLVPAGTDLRDGVAALLHYPLTGT